ncbi:hypothetical protein SEVIR_7G195250v4 [Setaria viridis]
MRPSIASRRERTGKAARRGDAETDRIGGLLRCCGLGSGTGREGWTRAWLVDSTNRVACAATRRGSSADLPSYNSKRLLHRSHRCAGPMRQGGPWRVRTINLVTGRSDPAAFFLEESDRAAGLHAMGRPFQPTQMDSAHGRMIATARVKASTYCVKTSLLAVLGWPSDN